MSEPRVFLDAVLGAVIDAVAPLEDSLADPVLFRALLEELGWVVEAGEIDPQKLDGQIPINNILDTVRNVLETIRAGEATPDLLQSLTRDTAALMSALGTASGNVPPPSLPPPLSRPELWGALAADLAGFLVARHIRATAPLLYALLHLFGIIDLEETAPGEHRRATRRVVLRWDRLGMLISDPAGLAGEVYGWGGTLRATELLDRSEEALRALGLSAGQVEPDEETVATYWGDPPAAGAPVRELHLLLATGTTDDGLHAEVGLAALPVPAQNGVAGPPSGILVSLFAAGDIALLITFGDSVTGRIFGAVDAGRLIGVELRPGDARWADSAAVQARAGLELTYAPPEPALLFGGRQGTGLRVGSAGLALAGEAGSAGFDVGVHVALSGLDLVVSFADVDAFVGRLLGTGELTFRADLGIGWSQRGGLRVDGQAGLRFELPMEFAVGPVRLSRLLLTAGPEAGGLALSAVVTVQGSLGPLTLVVEDVGATLRLLPTAGGAAAGLSPSLALRPPTGAGMSITAGPVTGGGFVQFDEPAGRYAGVLRLKIVTVGVTAVGLVQTRLPGGRPGFALLVLLRAEFPPIQVGFGIALSAVGGLLGLNRRVEVDALRRRFAAGAAGRILAPEDPIRDAPLLLAELDEVFPVSEGITLVGPTVQLSWVELVRLDLGVFVELPGPSKIVLLGSVRAAIENPAGGKPYLQLRLDVLGVLDFAKRVLEFDGVLIDSQLLEVFELTGGAAFRLGWGDQPYVVMSIGGFHPAYDPAPLALPASLTRLAMARGRPTDVLYLRFEGYFAITTNTLQFGASVQVIVNAGPIRAEGFLGFDVLIRFQPFAFEFGFRASVRVMFNGVTLAGVRVTGVLAGPGPVTFTGELCFEILFFEICWNATFTLGSDTPPAVQPIPSAFPVLGVELREPGNLATSMTEDPFVLLRPAPDTGPAPVLPPVGRLVWTQRRAPLDLLLERFEGAPLERRETITATGPRITGPAKDWFAPGSFAELSDSDALNRPALERLHCGVELAAAGDVASTAVTVTVTVEQYRAERPDPVPVPGEARPEWLHAALDRREGVADPAPEPPAVTVEDESWVVSEPSGVPAAAGLSQAQAHQLAKATGAVATAAGDRVPVFAF